ncbi:hypothetical protein GHT06_016696 [Daphnia sinensis]|uniref:Uncharacterized protein n=1 Tax=Daphnia sinensis TaxID=1820382 RepID=A0AAD5KNX6_9CRUS|nr:hypothetical protein GHT06_016696 [Daphnia sinensis]
MRGLKRGRVGWGEGKETKKSKKREGGGGAVREERWTKRKGLASAGRRRATRHGTTRPSHSTVTRRKRLPQLPSSTGGTSDHCLAEGKSHRPAKGILLCSVDALVRLVENFQYNRKIRMQGIKQITTEEWK